MFQHRPADGNGQRSGIRPKDTPGSESTSAILKRLLSHLRIMLAAYRLAAGREVRLMLGDIVVSAVWLGAALAFAVFAVGLAMATIVLALSLILPPWAAALAGFVGLAVVAAIALFAALRQLRRVRRRLAGLLRLAAEEARWAKVEILGIK